MINSKNYHNLNATSKNVAIHLTYRSILFFIAILFVQIFLSPIIPGHANSINHFEISSPKNQIPLYFYNKYSIENDEDSHSKTNSSNLDDQSTHNPENHTHGFLLIIWICIFLLYPGKIPPTQLACIIEVALPKNRPFKPPRS